MYLRKKRLLNDTIAIKKDKTNFFYDLREIYAIFII